MIEDHDWNKIIASISAFFSAAAVSVSQLDINTLATIIGASCAIITCASYVAVSYYKIKSLKKNGL